MGMQVLSLALLGGLGIWHCRELWYIGRSMDWIWHCCGCGVEPRAVALIQALAWELPYATGVALKRSPQKKTHNKYFGMNTVVLDPC